MTKFYKDIDNQFKDIAQDFTENQRKLMAYFVDSNQESLCKSEVTGMFPEYSERNKTLVDLVSFGLLIETQSNGQIAFTKGKYFSFFENHFRK